MLSFVLLCLSGNFHHGIFWIYLRDAGIAVFPCRKWRDVQPLSACGCVYNNKLSDVLPPNFLHRVKLKLIKFSKTNYSNYVLRTQHTIHTRDVHPCSTVHTLHCTCMPHVRKFCRRMAPCGMHTDNGRNRNKPYRYASHNAVCFRFGELHANNSREFAHKNRILNWLRSTKGRKI